MADARRLVKNTLFMYVRMILILAVSIYTSRAILDKLGVDDYGIYNAVASIVAMVTFLNATLSTSTSRFLTYDLGVGDMEKLKITFSTSFYTHLLMAGIIIVLLESVGLWYVNHKFVIPEGREFAVCGVFQISILTTAIAVMQVPYTAVIMAHENMVVYAYVSIYDAIARLGIVYMLTLSSAIDRLILYAILVAVVQISVMGIYVFICRRKYLETHLAHKFSKDTFKRMMGFTSWTMVANLSNTVKVQGSSVLLNLFFAPAIIAAKALSNQITNAMMQFVNNLRVALNPQIIKSYAAEEIDDFKKWSLRSTVVSSSLLLVISLPCLVAMKTILDIWLVEIPPLAVEFIQIAIIAQIIDVISSSTYIPFVASGKLKLNALFGVVFDFGYFIVLYVIYKLGGCALWAQWLYVILNIINVLFLRPYLLHKEVGFGYFEVYKCVLNCVKPMFVAGGLSYVMMKLCGAELWQQTVLFMGVFLVTCVTVWIFMEKDMKVYLLNFVKSKTSKNG